MTYTRSFHIRKPRPPLLDTASFLLSTILLQSLFLITTIIITIIIIATISINTFYYGTVKNGIIIIQIFAGFRWLRSWFTVLPTQSTERAKPLPPPWTATVHWVTRKTKPLRPNVPLSNYLVDSFVFSFIPRSVPLTNRSFSSFSRLRVSIQYTTQVKHSLTRSIVKQRV